MNDMSAARFLFCLSPLSKLPATNEDSDKSHKGLWGLNMPDDKGPRLAEGAPKLAEVRAEARDDKALDIY